VHLRVRHPGRFVDRDEHEWPLARTRWTRLHLDPISMTLEAAPAAAEGSVTYAGLGDGVTFTTAPFAGETEITGPVTARLFVSSSTADADLFLVLRVFAPDGSEVGPPTASSTRT
jgi:predicted acyl esterase